MKLLDIVSSLIQLVVVRSKIKASVHHLRFPLRNHCLVFFPIHSRHVPDILPLHLFFFPFIFQFSLFTLLILLQLLSGSFGSSTFTVPCSPTFLSKTS